MNHPQPTPSDERTATQLDIDQLSAKEYILIKNATVNNLKNLSVAIPRNKLVVVTGLSGSGKSSLVFDTLFAEGQRRYVESLSSYARQFLGKMEKPAVEYIRGITPAIAIEQKRNTSNPRSTVGTATEVYDYLRLLYARIGTTYSPISGQPVKRDSVDDVVGHIQRYPAGTKVLILYPCHLPPGKNLLVVLRTALGKGFSRILYKGQVQLIEDVLGQQEGDLPNGEVLVDRVVVDPQCQEQASQLADSVQTAFTEGEGSCIIEVVGQGRALFSDRFELDGMTFETPSIRLFNFHNPYEACQACGGFGTTLGIDLEKVIPNTHLSVAEGALAPWRSPAMQSWLTPLLVHSPSFDFPIHRSYKDLTQAQKDLLWEGNPFFQGLHAFFNHIASRAHKIQYRVLLSRYRGKTICPDCQGTRIKKEATYIKIKGKSITDLVLLSIAQLFDFFSALSLGDYEQKIATRVLLEIQTRLRYLVQVGLGYLTLNRQVATLSGGEYQRIKLATALGSTLVGTLYILDEPTVGLHPRDTRTLTHLLLALKQLGNTVVVVEHEEAVMRAADQLIDIGPEAGSGGGRLIFQGDWQALRQCHSSYTAQYLNGTAAIPIPTQRRAWKNSITIQGARAHNVQHIDVTFPLGVLTVVTGISGSGKSTLVNHILYPALCNALGIQVATAGAFDQLQGDVSYIRQVEWVDQNPIGRSSRSNPVTYIKAYDAIRKLFAAQPLARERGYQPAQFSFNLPIGRCEGCQGEGTTKIEMQFIADLYLTCEHCQGKRFKEETLAVTYRDKSVADVLKMTVAEGLAFFKDEPPIAQKLQLLYQVGLGYIGLGQSSDALSGGEAQRVKLAAYLDPGKSHQSTFFIFDEPTTGLHMHDIHQLLRVLQALVAQGNSVLIIEHNMEVVKCADWIIDLGPEAGEQGGQVVFQGTPEAMIQSQDSLTAPYLKEKMQPYVAF